MTNESAGVFANACTLSRTETAAEIVSEISRLMKLKKLTQAKAATLTGVAQSDLSNLLRGKFRSFSSSACC
jgi:predicted XRE-type DNA-binding protein